MSDASAAALECLGDHGNGVRVEFVKQGDRFSHEIFGVSKNQATLLLRSVEGTPDEVSPPSPPFAELHSQGNTLFLSGATSIGHWSMSVEAASGCLLFDVACRLKVASNLLGSYYRTLSDLASVDVSVGMLAQACDHKIRIAPQLDKSQEYPATIQWQYRIASK